MINHTFIFRQDSNLYKIDGLMNVIIMLMVIIKLANVYWEYTRAQVPMLRVFWMHLNNQNNSFILFQFYKEDSKLSKVDQFPKINVMECLPVPGLSNPEECALRNPQDHFLITYLLHTEDSATLIRIAKNITKLRNPSQFLP